VPRHPPHRATAFPFPHIPTDRGAVARTARRALGWISQSRKTRFVWVSLKMGSRARSRADAHHEAGEGPEPGTQPLGSRKRVYTVLSLPNRCSALSFLIYPPTGAQWRARPGGLWGGFPNPAKLDWYGLPLKMGSRARMARGRPARRPRRGAGRWEGAARAAYPRPRVPSRPTLHLPYTYPIPALDLPHILRPEPPTPYTAPRAGPACLPDAPTLDPDPPTLYPPARPTLDLP
jgi:hypothetical protein